MVIVVPVYHFCLFSICAIYTCANFT